MGIWYSDPQENMHFKVLLVWDVQPFRVYV